MTYGDLQLKLFDKPFQPFRIRMVNNSIYDITEPWLLAVSETTALVGINVFVGDVGYDVARGWKTISIAHILEFEDLKPAKAKKAKK